MLTTIVPLPFILLCVSGYSGAIALLIFFPELKKLIYYFIFRVCVCGEGGGGGGGGVGCYFR